MLSVLRAAPPSAPSTMKTGNDPTTLSKSHPPAMKTMTPAAKAHPNPE